MPTPTDVVEVVPTPTPVEPVVVVPTPTPAPSPSQTPQPPSLAGVSLEVRLDWNGLTELFSRQGLEVQPALEQISVMSLDGAEIDARGGEESHDFGLPPGSAYLINARTADGVNLWALTPKLLDTSVQTVSLQSTYEAGLIYAAQSLDDTVTGQLKAETIVLAKTAKVLGDIIHESLEIEAGAFVEGSIRRIGSEKPRTSQNLGSVSSTGEALSANGGGQPQTGMQSKPMAS